MTQNVEAPALGAIDERRPRVGSRFNTVVAAHAVTDFLSFVIIPLMSLLEDRAHFTHAQGANLLAVGSISSGIIQPIVALVSDKYDTRWLGTLGLVVAAVAIGLVGYAENYHQLLLLQAFGAAGIGAFHPVATAAAGHLSGARRTLGISVFYAAGMFGSVAAGWTVPAIVREAGITRLVFLTPVALVMSAFLAWAIHSIPHRHAGAHADHAALADEERQRRWFEIGLLYITNAIRFTVNMMLIQLIIRWTERWTLAQAGALELTEPLRLKVTSINGPLQGAMAIGMGVASLLVGWFGVARHEKTILVTVPLMGVVAIAAFPASNAIWIAFCLAILAGVGYQGVMPITLTMAQRLLPHRTSLASALMLGGAWTLAASGPPLAQRLCNQVGLDAAFEWVAALLLLSVGLTLPLRGIEAGGRRG
jgi:MFS family permease